MSAPLPDNRVAHSVLSRTPWQALRESRRTRRLLTLLFAGGASWLAVRYVAAKLLSAMLYHPFRYANEPAYDSVMTQYKNRFGELSYELEEVSYSLRGHLGRASKGQQAFLLHPKSSPTGSLWLLFGGNAMVSMDWFDFCWSMLSAMDDTEKPAFLLIDYPGYGANAGSPSPGTVLATQLAGLRAALPRLAARPSTLHLLGHSLGAAAASQLASHLPKEADGSTSALSPGRLVLSAPFLSIDAMAQEIFGPRLLPSWLLGVLLTEHWNNAAWVPQAAEAGWDVSIIHGTRDEIVPMWMGKAIQQRVLDRGLKCDFVEVKKRGHNDLLGTPKDYARLMGFDTTMGGRGAAL